MTMEVPQAEVAGNLRHTLVEVLRTFAAPLTSGPLIGGPGELFCQWADDMYHPEAAAFELAFGPNERAALATFDVVFRQASAAFPAVMPPVETYIMSGACVDLASAASVALQSMGVCPDD